MNSQPKPPAWIDRFLRWRLPEKQFEEVQGDMHELYHQWVQEAGKKKARLRYILNAFTFLRPLPEQKNSFDQKNKYYSQANSMNMFSSYFKVGSRNMIRQKAHSFINMGGLAIGMAVAMLIGLWIWDELSYNKNHQNYDHIARVYRQETWRGETGVGTSMQLPVGTELRSVYGADFTYVVTSSWTKNHILSFEDKKFTQPGKYMQPEGPQLLTLDMLKGSRNGLAQPHSILLSASLAKKLFDLADPMGKLIKINNTQLVKVTGIYADLPHNSEYKDVTFIAPWDLLFTSDQYLQSIQNNWDAQEVEILVQIPDHTSFEKAEAKIKDVILRHVNGDYKAAKPALILHPMRKWHLYSEFENGVSVGSERLKFVWFYGIIGVFILTLACINFMNLSTARSQQRAKEVGIRKTMGSFRSQLIYQFLSESLLVAILSFALSLILVQLALPYFNEIADKKTAILWTNPGFWLLCFGFISLTGLLAGSYPALYLSSFNPVKVLKGTMHMSRLALIPRRILVIIQFSVSITLIIGTFIVYRQIIFTKNRPVGYSRNGLIMVQKTTGDFYGKYEVLRNELKQTGAIYEMAEASSPVTGLWHSNQGFDWKGKDPAMYASFATVSITPEYGKTVGWEFVAGRDFSHDNTSDSTGFIINEAAARYLGLENPVGEFISWDAGWRKKETFTVLGVVKDMVTESPFEPVKPTIFYIQDEKNWIMARINPALSTSEALAKIEKAFTNIIPSAPFDYKFVDQEYAIKFAAEERIGKLAGFFASLAIFISCLGLFGLASFTTEQRSKEISIRKVLGASAAHLWAMLSKEFVVLVLVSCLIAMPVTYYFLSNWLEKYPYRTNISWWIFSISGLLAIFLALLTVSFQAIKAALANPIKSLRNE